MNTSKLRLLGAAVTTAAKLTGWGDCLRSPIDNVEAVSQGSIARHVVGATLKKLVTYHFVYSSALDCKIEGIDVWYVKSALNSASPYEYAEAMYRYRSSQLIWDDAKCEFLADVARDSATRIGVYQFLKSSASAVVSSDCEEASVQASINAFGELLRELLVDAETVKAVFGDEFDDLDHLADGLYDHEVIKAVAREVLS